MSKRICLNEKFREAKKRVFSRKGYVTATALVTMLLVMAFGGGMLWLASYNFSNALSQHKEKQVYFYARSFIAQSDEKILYGGINASLTELVLEVNNELFTVSSHDERKDFYNKYCEKYVMQAVLGENSGGEEYFLKNPSSHDLVSLIMDIRYLPHGNNSALPKKNIAGTESVDDLSILQVGDILEIKYEVRLVDVEKRSLAYIVTTTFRCVRDASKNADGSYVTDTNGNIIPKVITDMKWVKESDMGEHIYETK